MIRGEYNMNAIEQEIINKWTCEVKRDSLTVASLVEKIDKGYKREPSGIILDPIYQREYKFTGKKESSIIESLILNIPIPVIYLSQDIEQDIIVFNMIDGMHRCKSIYRFVKDEYRLTGLKILQELNGCKFSMLPKKEQNKLLYNTQLEINSINVSENHELEYEVFLRFNEKTNPLTPQELLEVMYRSEYSYWFKEYVSGLCKTDKDFQLIFNTNGKEDSNAIKNKTILSNVYACMAYARYGLKKGKNDTPQYVTAYMEDMKKKTPNQTQQMKDYTINYLKIFTNLYARISELEKISHIVSKEFISKKSSQGSHVFLISFLIPLTMACDYCLTKGIITNNMSDQQYHKIYLAIVSGMKKSNFGDFGGVSSTSIKVQSKCCEYIKVSLDQAFNLI